MKLLIKIESIKCQRHDRFLKSIRSLIRAWAPKIESSREVQAEITRGMFGSKHIKRALVHL